MFSTFNFGNHRLQTIDILKSHNASKKWVVFIHGGAWRDPANTSHDGHKLLFSLVKDIEDISAASLNYRLSPEVVHPVHILDVIAGLEFLVKNYPVDEIVLVGHSAGAFLALQVLILATMYPEITSKIKVIIGVEGLYDLRSTVEEDASYEDFVALAFGKDKDEWDLASPCSGEFLFVNDERLESPNEVAFPGGSIVIVHSPDDELLSDKFQPVVARNALIQSRRPPTVHSETARGGHNEVLQVPELVTIVKKYL